MYIHTNTNSYNWIYTYLLSTATGGDDYTSGGYEVTFPAGSSTAQLTIDITDDDIAELTESFTAHLSVSQSVSDLGVSVGSDDTATVNIEDNDGECMDVCNRLQVMHNIPMHTLSNPYTRIIPYSTCVSTYVRVSLAVVIVEFQPFEYTVSESDEDVGLILVADKEASFNYTVEVTTADSTASGEFIVKYVHTYVHTEC